MDGAAIESAAILAFYEDEWKTSVILRRDHEQEEIAENKRQQVFLAQWEAILLEQLAPHSKTDASRIMLTYYVLVLKRKQILKQ